MDRYIPPDMVRLMRANLAKLHECHSRSQDNRQALAAADEDLLKKQQQLRDDIQHGDDSVELRKAEAAYINVCRRRAAIAAGHNLACETMRHLAILDPENGDQPDSDEDGGTKPSADG